MLSVVILTKNEEGNIIDAIESADFADEILVIDDFSDDHTREAVEALRSPKIKVIRHHLKDFSAQRNFALTKVKGDYIFFLDADERISPGLRGEIQQILKDGSSKNGFFVKRKDVMWGKELKHGETANISLLRLAKKSRGEWKGKVHEEWDIKGPTKVLKYPLYHHPHPTAREFIADINKYTDIRAKELHSRGDSTSLFQIVSFPLGKFLQNYILRQGFKDGTSGFIFAMLMSLHSFLVRAKLWQLSKDN